MTAARLPLLATLAVLLVAGAGGCAKTAVQGRADLSGPGDMSGSGQDDLSQSTVDDLALPPPPDYAGLDVAGLDLFLVLPDTAAPPPDFTGLVVDLVKPPADLTGVVGCTPDPMTDGTANCSACPVGTIGVRDYQSTLCHCWTICDPAAMTSSCVCGRRCSALVTGDGAASGGACLPANGAAERCGADTAGNLYGKGACADGTLCVSLDTTHAYCMYSCAVQSNCPRATECLTLSSMAKACIMNSDPSGKAQGMTCTYTDLCALGAVCDGVTCKPQCDGPTDTATCTTGSCTASTDTTNGNKISSYVCK